MLLIRFRQPEEKMTAERVRVERLQWLDLKAIARWLYCMC